MALERLELKQQLPYYIDSSNFEGKLESIIDFLHTLPEKLTLYGIDVSSYHNFSIETSNRAWDEGTEWVLYGWYWENDYQLHTREETLKFKQKNDRTIKRNKIKLQEEKDKLDYERLKQKYGF